MKKSYLFLLVFCFFLTGMKVSALQTEECNVLAILKKSSSLDEEQYICKGKEFGKNTDAIYYSGEGNIIKFTNFNGYYFSTSEKAEVEISLTGNNNLSLLHVYEVPLTITGTGSLKFKEASYAKMVENGEPVYQYFYKEKALVLNKSVITGTKAQFEELYSSLVYENKLPEEYLEENFTMQSINDYTKMTPVVITPTWFEKNVKTTLSTSVTDGFGFVTYVEDANTEAKTEVVEKKEEKTNKVSSSKNVLETEQVIFVSKKKINSKYELQVENLKETELSNKVEKLLDELNLLNLYNISVYNGKKEVQMNNGEYTIKIKIGDALEAYQEFQVIYVNDLGEIEEYIDATLEDGYLVFQTTHLSHYGVVASPIMEEVENVLVTKKDYSWVFKISVLLIFSLLSLVLVGFIIVKSRSYKTKSN